LLPAPAGRWCDATGGGADRPPLTPLDAAPKQGDEGAPEATIIFAGEFVAALEGIAAGDDVLVLAWLDRADRDVLRVHPRGDESRPETGVFATRSPDRPNPIGLHRVEVVSIDGATMTVRGLEAVDGTPVLDVKPVLSGDAGER
jgi:tRNA-Thr(GGU) m(6)t(6)A37 methyltransferase TsaA